MTMAEIEQAKHSGTVFKENYNFLSREEGVFLYVYISGCNTFFYPGAFVLRQSEQVIQKIGSMLTSYAIRVSNKTHYYSSV